METKNIKIYVEEKETKDENGKTRKFNVYHTYTKNGRKMQVKFRKEFTNLPTEKCTAVICKEDMNIDSSSRFPTLWVVEVQEYLPFVTEEDTEKHNKKIDDMFD